MPTISYNLGIAKIEYICRVDKQLANSKVIMGQN